MGGIKGRGAAKERRREASKVTATGGGVSGAELDTGAWSGRGSWSPERPLASEVPHSLVEENGAPPVGDWAEPRVLKLGAEGAGGEGARPRQGLGCSLTVHEGWLGSVAWCLRSNPLARSAPSAPRSKRRARLEPPGRAPTGHTLAWNARGYCLLPFPQHP